jgi:hypothetical protein
MAKVVKYEGALVDSQGYQWVTGFFTVNQIQTWRKRYHAQGIYLSWKE